MSDEQPTATPEEKNETPKEEQPTPEAAPAEETKQEEAPAEATPEAEAPAEKKKEEAPTEEPASEAAPTQEAPTEPEAPAELAYKEKLSNIEEIKPGMTIVVHERIKDVNPKGEVKERIQKFEGIVLGLSGSGIARTITVRKVSKGYGVEKIFPINSPNIAKFEGIKRARVRQAKLGYLKNLKKRFKRKLKETKIAK